MRIGALEAGGTKMVCAVGDENGQILERASIVTENPDKTMPEILEFFRQYTLDAIGIGTANSLFMLPSRLKFLHEILGVDVIYQRLEKLRTELPEDWTAVFILQLGQV